jgi:hypothetical protein
MTTTPDTLTPNRAPNGPDLPALAFTLPADLAAATWHALAAAVAGPKDGRDVLRSVHVSTDPDGLTLTACDTFVAHRVTIPRTLDAAALPFLPHPDALLHGWKAADLARLCKDAHRVRFTAATGATPATMTPATVEALDVHGATVATLAGTVSSGEFPNTLGQLFDRDGWATTGDRVGFDPARLARSLTAADKFRGKDSTPVAVESMAPNKPARYTLTRPDGATLAAIVMAHGLPTEEPGTGA